MSDESDREVRQTLRRAKTLGPAMAALATRAPVTASPDVMRVSYQEWERMVQDGEFKTLAQYVRLLTEYSDGRPRATPVRPILENEVGMYRGKIVCIKGNNPGDSGALVFPVNGLKEEK